ncbi:MAG: Npt1/Npt2 family nucleotide transporter [Halioglobus sp.]
MQHAHRPSNSTRWLDRLVHVFGDVRPGEGRMVLMMFLNVYFLLMAYYILKTVREPLILATGGAELKSYAAGFQAIVLVAYVPFYGWLAGRLPRPKLLVYVVLGFAACIVLFAGALSLEVPYIGFAFYVFLGIFSVSMIAQFWSYANELYQREAGERLFPLIAVGSTAGGPIGAAVAGWLYASGTSSVTMMHIAAGLLLVHLGLYYLIMRSSSTSTLEQQESKPLTSSSGFALVFQSRYLMLIAGLLVLLNVVNTTGEYILSRVVLDYASELQAGQADFNTEAYIGEFYGQFFFWVNVATILIQALLVSRLVKFFGMAGVLFALPIIALGTYSLPLLGAGMMIFIATKLAENATDYSVMNTAKQMLWLQTTPDEKYKAKQAIDTFFVRTGDVIAAALVFVGTQWIGLDLLGFSAVNVALILTWMFVAYRLLQQYNVHAKTSTDH